MSFMRFGLLLLGVSAFAAAPDFDLLIRGGRIADGAGNPAWYGDIGIRQGKIAAMGHLAGRTAARTIEATGLTVSPGFIDVHNHSDYTVVEDGNAESMVRQGVTSMILGEGGSAAPGKRWKDLSAYFAQLRGQGISTNIGTSVSVSIQEPGGPLRELATPSAPCSMACFTSARIRSSSAAVGGPAFSPRTQVQISLDPT